MSRQDKDRAMDRDKTKEKTRPGERHYGALLKSAAVLDETRAGIEYVGDSGDTLVAELEALLNSGGDGDSNIGIAVEDLVSKYIVGVNGHVAEVGTKLQNVQVNTGGNGNGGWSVDDVSGRAVGGVKVDDNGLRQAIAADSWRRGEGSPICTIGGETFDAAPLREMEDKVLANDMEAVWRSLNDRQDTHSDKSLRALRSEHDGSAFGETESTAGYTLRGLLAAAAEGDSEVDTEAVLGRVRQKYWSTENLQGDAPLPRVLLAGHVALGQLVTMQTLLRRRRSSVVSISDTPVISSIGSGDATSINTTVGTSTASATVSTGTAVSSVSTEMGQELTVPNMVGGHPVHVCPVLRQETTGPGHPNSASALPCGHVLGAQALQQLATTGGTHFNTYSTHGARSGTSIKCPYCPSRSNASNTRQVVFEVI